MALPIPLLPPTTIIIATHNMSLVKKLGNTFLRLENGNLKIIPSDEKENSESSG